MGWSRGHTHTQAGNKKKWVDGKRRETQSRIKETCKSFRTQQKKKKLEAVSKLDVEDSTTGELLDSLLFCILLEEAGGAEAKTLNNSQWGIVRIEHVVFSCRYWK